MSSVTPNFSTAYGNYAVGLHYQDSSSDKVYNVWIEQIGPGYTVQTSYGRRGSTLNYASKSRIALPLADAVKLYNKVVNEKTAKGYQVKNKGSVAGAVPNLDVKTESGILPMLLVPIDETEVDEFLENDDYVLQEKHDGERRLVNVSKQLSDAVKGINRKGQYVNLSTVLHNDLVRLLKHNNTVILDGEQIGDNYYVFDILQVNQANVKDLPYHERLKHLQDIFKSCGSKLTQTTIVKTAEGFSAKCKLLDELKASNKEGCVFKHKLGFYSVGKQIKAGQFKYKFYDTASFVVHKINQQRSVKLKLYTGRQPGEYVLVGNVTIPVNHPMPEVGAVAEVRYLYAYLGGSVYQPVYLGKRLDITPEECLLSQLKYKPNISLI